MRGGLATLAGVGAAPRGILGGRVRACHPIRNGFAVSASAIASRLRARLGLYAVLTKLRLSGLVLTTTATAYLLARRGRLDWAELAATLGGTLLCAFSAAALNQLWERERDGRMERTRERPLPSGRLSPREALIAALLMLAGGQALLLAGTNRLTAALALATVLLYVLVYTPLKPRSSLNTLVGAVCGALPPMLGWTAAAGRLELGAWLVGLLLFLWQVPHFLALAWLYREDYARGGFRMLPAVDPGGQLTGALSALYSLALLPLGIAFALAGLAGPTFAGGFALLGLALFAASLRLWRRLDRASARRLFLASVIVLPLALLLLLVDATPRTGAPASPGPLAAETSLPHARLR